MATVYACQGPGDIGVRAVQVSRCCPWAARAVRSSRGVFRGLVRRARLSGSIHFIKELNNQSRYCFSWHAVQGRIAADWRMARVSGDLLGKTICGARYAVTQRDGYNFVTCRKNRAAGWSRPRALPRQGATVRKAPDMAHGALFGLRRVTTPVWSGQGDFLLHGAIVRPGSADRAGGSCHRWGASRTQTGRSMAPRLARNRPHIPVTDRLWP